MSKNKKQTAVIGVGGFGKNHARNLSLISNLVAICDKNEEIGKKQASLYDHVRYYSDIEEMLKSDKLDAVCIATPPSVIPSLTKKCASKGIDVLMEKPMGLVYEELEQIANEYSVRLHPGFIELYNPVFDELKKNLPKIGDILTISSKRVGLYPRRYWGMGVVLDLTTHDVYLHQNLLGEVKNVKSMLRFFHDKRFEDAAYVLMDFGDAKSLIESNWLTPTKYRKMWVSGELGTLEVDFIAQYLKILEGKDLTGPQPEIWETQVSYLMPKEPLKEELLDFLYSDKPKITLKEQGLKTIKVVLDILKAGSI